MKLLQCKIENFGKLSDVSLTFQRVSIHSARKTDGEKVRLRILSELCFLVF